jgi:aminoglycoside phosphotransferase (APT) family kinase protein
MIMKLPRIVTNEDFTTHFESDFWLEAAREICRRHRVFFREIKRGASSDHVVFLLDDVLVLKIYRPFRNCFEREIKALGFVHGKLDFRVPEVFQTGEFEGFRYALISQMRGNPLTRAEWLTLPETEQIEFISKLAAGLKQIHTLDAGTFENDWSEFVRTRAATFIERQARHGVNEKVLKALPAFIEENLPLVPLAPKTVFMHADVHFGNLRVLKSNGAPSITGLFDFADSRCGFHEYEFLAVGVLMMQGQKQVQREFFRSYGYAEKDLDESMRKRLMMLTMLYETADLRRYAMRLSAEAVEFSLDELERGIWSFT